jgi:hypothetical protein
LLIKFMTVGFKYAAKAGISFGKEDFSHT